MDEPAPAFAAAAADFKVAFAIEDLEKDYEFKNLY